MLRFFLKRLLFMVPILIGITIITFAIAEFSSTDPAEASIRVNGMLPTAELIEATRQEFGLDKPFLTRYADWLSGALHGDLGLSYVTRLPVTNSILEALPATLFLALTALLIIISVSLAAGTLSARAENSKTDWFIRGFIFFTSSMPGFWAALILIWIFSVQLNVFPTNGMRSTSSVVLPAVTLSLAYIGTYMRLIRSEMIKTAHEDWVLFARGRGLSEKSITWHMIKNSLHASLTALGMSIPKLIAGAFIIETIFAWPGIGRLCVEAVFNRDLPIIQAYVLLMATLFVFFNLVSDLLVTFLDPRQRDNEKGSL
ncbi:ABC transporter permease subunit [Parasutterella secunda]|uniref:nickel/cobalt ABC transporter permease n=1 Tax=Parasutterella secunda TaxID=626947 RepID=UPI002011BFE4|nr:nickel/cobalt ABC transporter permease [Parasutterella secunda]MCL1597195.1 ABC transporter permease subunit [Parasutterella secunda]